ncbi:hypothetical protein [Massilia sp. TSP1-1-2]|uniref:hypothetical protein n=1 Tax=unclassified Massilia TaxID=2609279 RepID=UPI003CF881E7
MAALTCAQWLAAWEDSAALAPALRPCALLAPLMEGGQEAAQALSVGQRDAHLLDLYQALFGPRIEVVAACPACAAMLELEVEPAGLRLPFAAHPARVMALDAGGHYITFRLPDSCDMAAAAACADPIAARNLLLERCVSAAAVDGGALAAHALPPEVVDAVARAMADADPQALTELALTCPSCAHGWDAPFEIAHFLTEALGHWAARMLDQVHALATAYHWSEDAIFALTPARRAQYLARVCA